LLLDYKSVLLETASKSMPHILCKYAYDLTKAFSSLYNNIHILNEENEDKKILRLKLVELYSVILKDAFSLLAIEMPEKM
jgi:arginyl-tRNA synthetase